MAIKGYEHNAAIRLMDLQGKTLKVQDSMHERQCTHEERMKRLEGYTAARIERIRQQGKTERLGICAVKDAFNRDNWNMGKPTFLHS